MWDCKLNFKSIFNSSLALFLASQLNVLPNEWFIYLQFFIIFYCRALFDFFFLSFSRFVDLFTASLRIEIKKFKWQFLRRMAVHINHNKMTNKSIFITYSLPRNFSQPHLLVIGRIKMRIQISREGEQKREI